MHLETVMKDGKCAECGAMEVDGLSCFEQFGYPLTWEQEDLKLYELHFWLVSCYMIQHPSNFTKEGHSQFVNLFIEAYDQGWESSYILKKNQEWANQNTKISNPLPFHERERELQHWSITITDIYKGGKDNAYENIKRWQKALRSSFLDIGSVKF